MQNILLKDSFLQLIMDHIPIYVFWKDRDSNYLGCNKNFAQAAGFNSPEELIGKSDYDLPWKTEEAIYYRHIDSEVMKTGESKINFEEMQTMADHSLRWIVTSKVPLYEEGQVVGVLGTYEDITQRKELEISLKNRAEEIVSKNIDLIESNKKLEQANIDLEHFAYATSHDLQEPLRMMTSFAGLLQQKYGSELDQTGRDYLHYIIDGAHRMSSMITKLLSYSKIRNDQSGYVNMNLRDIVIDSQNKIQTYLKEQNAQVRINLPDVEIQCQPERISMLFNNLIVNGVKFNSSHEPQVQIDFKERETDYQITISDNGLGIEQEYHEMVFIPFQRLQSRQEYPGSGIGLSICKRIVKIHGGHIWFTPNEPKGTQFHFTLQK